jgi:hypothetical protein
MALAAFIVSIVAVMTSVGLGWRALTLARHSNTMPVLIDLFREHRSERLADARQFVYFDLPKCDLSLGMEGLPEDKRAIVRDLAWFYDNLGALVAHGVIDIEPVSGYLGQAVLLNWERMERLIQAERNKRQDSYDPERWQIYFENLYHLVRQLPPQKARSAQGRWRLQTRASGNSLVSGVHQGHLSASGEKGATATGGPEVAGPGTPTAPTINGA